MTPSSSHTTGTAGSGREPVCPEIDTDGVTCCQPLPICNNQHFTGGLYAICGLARTNLCGFICYGVCTCDEMECAGEDCPYENLVQCPVHGKEQQKKAGKQEGE